MPWPPGLRVGGVAHSYVALRQLHFAQYRLTDWEDHGSAMMPGLAETAHATESGALSQNCSFSERRAYEGGKQTE